MAFRGHGNNDVARNLNFDVENNYFRTRQGEGNFIGLVKLLAGENKDLAEHLRQCENYAKTGARNQLTFFSSHFINSVLRIVREHLVRTIVNDINKNGGYYGVLMDGSQDVATKEQISVAVRYVNESNVIVERTIAFFNASKDTSGKALYDLMREALSDVGLSISKIVGCSFDGASNMRSDDEGVKAYIQQNNARCIFTWCISHRFNLVMKTATGNSDQIKCILQSAEDCAKLFRNSYKKMDVWIDVAKSVPNFNSQRRLKLIGTTRWSSKDEAIDGIMGSETNLYVLIKSLIKVCNLKNILPASLLIATHALNFWLQYENVVAGFVLHKVFSLVVQTTKYLQNNGMNILDAIKSLKKLYSALGNLKENLHSIVEEAHTYIENLNFLLENDDEIVSLDSECSIAHPIKDEKQKINQDIIVNFRDFIQTIQHEIDRKILQQFDESETIFHEILFLDPRYAEDNFHLISLTKLCEMTNITDETVVVNEFENFFSDFSHHNRPKYQSVLNNNEYNISELNTSLDDEDEQEIRSLINVIEVLEDTTPVEDEKEELIPMHQECNCLQCILIFLTADDRKKNYENVSKLYKYVAKLPSTQVKCERNFSKMKFIKSRLRSNMSDVSLENLMIISTESDMFEDVNLDDILGAIIGSSLKIALYMG